MKRNSRKPIELADVRDGKPVFIKSSGGVSWTLQRKEEGRGLLTSDVSGRSRWFPLKRIVYVGKF